MPLYKNKIKRTALSQISNTFSQDEKVSPELKRRKISVDFKQPLSCSQSSIQDIFKKNGQLKSPDYPDKFERTANDPKESAFMASTSNDLETQSLDKENVGIYSVSKKRSPKKNKSPKAISITREETPQNSAHDISKVLSPPDDYLNESTQSSNISLKDPQTKQAYLEFIENNTDKKFRRIQTPKEVTHYEKLKWLQKQRNTGVYVHCDRCDKIRYLEEIKDPTDLPDKWYCEKNTDLTYNSCEIAEEKFPLHVQADWIDNLYNAGSLVWAKVDGYPWWPGLVDDDPDTECYYWLDNEFTDEPSYYHVTFFDSKQVTRAWLEPKYIKSFTKVMNKREFLKLNKCQAFKKRIEYATKQAEKAAEMPLLERLEKFSFLARWGNKIKEPMSKVKMCDEDIEKPKSKSVKKKTSDLKIKKLDKAQKQISTMNTQKQISPMNRQIDEKAKTKTQKKTKRAGEEYLKKFLSFEDLEFPISPFFDKSIENLFETF